MMTLLLAAIKVAPTPTPAPGAAATPAPGVENELPQIRDIAGPVDIPAPLYETIFWIAGAALLLGLAAWIIWQCWPRPLPPPPLTARQIALAELARLREQVHARDPHEFAFDVTGVLRRFIETQFGMHALEQTSDEFLAEVARSSRFSVYDRRLLEAFLERADLLRYALQGTDVSASEALLNSATDFVHGGRM